MPATADRTDRTIERLTEELNSHRTWMEGQGADLRALHILIRYDRKTAKILIDFRPQVERV